MNWKPKLNTNILPWLAWACGMQTEAPVRAPQVYYGLKLQRDVTLWEYNTNTKALAPASDKRRAEIELKGRQGMAKNCLYLQARNLKNAKRKLSKFVEV